MTLSNSGEWLAALHEAGLAIEPHRYNAGEWYLGTVMESLGAGGIGRMATSRAPRGWRAIALAARSHGRARA
jgi:hypothetical protein